MTSRLTITVTYDYLPYPVLDLAVHRLVDLPLERQLLQLSTSSNAGAIVTATQYYLPEFDHEMSLTRRVLERVPIDKLAWKPHTKSMSLGQLASHVAQLPDWMSYILTADHFDFRPPNAPAYAPANCKTSQELLDLFDRSVASSRKAISGASDDSLDTPWTLKAGDLTMFTSPRWSVFRGFGMNHIVHHRAQLGLYLRLLDVPVPGIYGPSADER